MLAQGLIDLLLIVAAVVFLIWLGRSLFGTKPKKDAKNVASKKEELSQMRGRKEDLTEEKVVTEDLIETKDEVEKVAKEVSKLDKKL